MSERAKPRPPRLAHRTEAAPARLRAAPGRLWLQRAAAPMLLLVSAAAAGQGGDAPARDSLDLGTTSITGNQELPKVLYIVPWKTSDLGEILGRPANTLLDEVLAPIDPEVFERHLDYYAKLFAERAEASADPPESTDAQTEED